VEDLATCVVGNPTQMLHVWIIYLHFPQKLPNCRAIFHTWSVWAILLT
jgi:ribulose-5-phosphate 4-epimerase/fuculose-1-phosphate aldolase